MSYYTDNSVMMGMKHPTKHKAVPNIGEQLFSDAWEIVRDSVYDLQETGWALDKKGEKELAGKYYQGANIYFYLIYYATIMRNYLERNSLQDTCFDLCRFKIECVEKNLPCLSDSYDTDYVSAWARLKEMFGLNVQPEKCGECCLGISEMIIDYKDDDCYAFIIGPCELSETPDEGTPQNAEGEFSPCEFDIDEVNNDPGTDYSDCD